MSKPRFDLAAQVATLGADSLPPSMAKMSIQYPKSAADSAVLLLRQIVEAVDLDQIDIALTGDGDFDSWLSSARKILARCGEG